MLCGNGDRCSCLPVSYTTSNRRMRTTSAVRPLEGRHIGQRMMSSQPLAPLWRNRFAILQMNWRRRPPHTGRLGCQRGGDLARDFFFRERCKFGSCIVGVHFSPFKPASVCPWWLEPRMDNMLSALPKPTTASDDSSDNLFGMLF